MTTTCPICQELGSSPVCKCCGHNQANPPLSNCHRAEIFYVQEQAFCSTCRNPCKGVERAKIVPTPNTIYDSVEFLIDHLEHVKFVVENPKSVSGMFGLTETLETLDRELPKIKEKLTTRQIERELIAAQEAIARKDEALETAYQFITSDSLGEGCICNIADASDGRITCQSCNDSIAAQNAITQALSTH